MESFEDKIAIVTGGGTGIGRELTRQLASAGCHVAICDVSAENMAQTREICAEDGSSARVTTHEQLRQALVMQGEALRDQAPTTAEDAAKIILDGVRAGQWRILVGEDAHVLDRLVRDDPESAYTEAFYERLRDATDWRLGELSI
jgi:NAD(P)-dependent dehydrogenase (short-subunit alcohol dehydrogenase family)